MIYVGANLRREHVMFLRAAALSLRLSKKDKAGKSSLSNSEQIGLRALKEGRRQHPCGNLR
jgi:hypothetical protein